MYNVLLAILVGIEFSLAIGGFALASDMSVRSAQNELQRAAPGQANAAIDRTYAQVLYPNVAVYKHPPDFFFGLDPVRRLGTGYIWVSLAITRPVNFLGEDWYLINSDEYVSAKDLAIFTPSSFAGTVFDRTPDKPFAFVLHSLPASDSPGSPPNWATPTRRRYTRVTLYEEQEANGWKWYRIGEGQWIEQRQLGIVKPSPRPEGVAPNDKWIEIGLYEQTLAAYEGDQLKYATLVSTGLPQYGWTTTPGLFRIWGKARLDKMSGREGLPDYYYLEDVPWIMYFNRDMALHGAYWHDAFGAPHSHGCVNLAPLDAFWLFQWTTPVANPSNWSISTPANPGTWVWVHE